MYLNVMVFTVLIALNVIINVNAVNNHNHGNNWQYIVSSSGSIKVEAELIFNQGNAAPNATSVTDTLVEAASSSNFSLSVNTSSIVSTGKDL